MIYMSGAMSPTLTPHVKWGGDLADREGGLSPGGEPNQARTCGGAHPSAASSTSMLNSWRLEGQNDVHAFPTFNACDQRPESSLLRCIALLYDKRNASVTVATSFILDSYSTVT